MPRTRSNSEHSEEVGVQVSLNKDFLQRKDEEGSTLFKASDSESEGETATVIPTTSASEIDEDEELGDELTNDNPTDVVKDMVGDLTNMNEKLMKEMSISVDEDATFGSELTLCTEMMENICEDDQTPIITVQPPQQDAKCGLYTIKYSVVFTV